MLLIPTTVNEWSYLKFSINKICAYESGMLISLSGLRVVGAPSRTCEAISGAPSQAPVWDWRSRPIRTAGSDGGARGNDGLQLASAPGLSWTAHTPAMCAFIAITKLSVINALANCSMHDQTIK